MPTVLETETVELPPRPTRDSSRPKAKSRWWLWLLMLAIVGGSAYWLVEKSRAKQAAAAAERGRQATAPSVPVVVAPARTGEIPVYLNGLGSVTPLNSVTVKSRIDGQLINVTFQEGQFVKQGDLLAEIDTRPFEVQLAQAQAQLAKDQAQLNNAKVDLARYQYLVEQGVIPHQQLDTQTASVTQSEAVIKADQAQIDNVKLQLVYCHITAPIGGRIGLRQVDPGNMIRASDPNGLVVITQLQPIAVLFPIPEDNLMPVLKRLRAGEHLPVEAYDRSGQTKIATGHLLTVDNQIDQSTGTSRLKAYFENKEGGLFPNQFVNVRLLVEVKKGKILIPAVAIQRGPRGTFVYVVKDDQTVDVRQVTVGTTEGNDAAIESGLSDSEQVVVDGMDKLRAGSKVQISSKPRSGQ